MFSYTSYLFVVTALKSKLRKVLLQSHTAGWNSTTLWHLNPVLPSGAAGLLSSEALHTAASTFKKKQKTNQNQKNPRKAPSRMQAGTSAIPWHACTTSKQASYARQITWWGFQEPARKTWTSYICHSKLCIFLPGSCRKVSDCSDAVMGWVSLQLS